MIEFSASVLEEARQEVSTTIAEAHRQLVSGKLVDALMAIRWIGEALTGKAIGDSHLWPEARFRKVVATLLRAVQEEAPRGDHSVMTLRESLLTFKALEERVATRHDSLLSGRPHEIKAVLSLTEVHATYLLDEYEVLLNRQLQGAAH